MKESKKLTRREWLERGAVVGLVIVGSGSVLAACARGTVDCSSPPELSADQRDQRRLLEYVERSPNTSQRCQVCNFFTAAGENQCGNCTLNLGAVNPGGHCTSFAARA